MSQVFEDDIFDKKAPKVEDSEFYNCEFADVDFAEDKFYNAKFVECAFLNCNLSNISLTGASFRESHFLKCKLMGVNWTSCASIFDLKFLECSMDYAVFQGLDLKEFKLNDCSLREGDFSGAVLKRAIFAGSDLRGAFFSQCDLRECDFRGALNYSIDVRENKVKKAKFSLPEGLSLLDTFEIELE